MRGCSTRPPTMRSLVWAMDDSDVGAGLHGRETPKVLRSLSALAVLAFILAAFLISVRSVGTGTVQLEKSRPGIIGLNRAADGDGGGVPCGAPDSVYSAANTANLTESQVKQRQVIAAVGLGSATLVLFALAVVGLYKKRGRLSIGPLAIKSDAGLTWRGQPLTCSRPGQQHYTEVGDTEVAASGDIEVAAPGDTEVAAPNETGPVADSAAAISIADEDQAKEDDAVKAERLYDEQQRVMKKYHLWMAARKTLLLVLFIVYVGASVGIPWWKASSVSCENGLYWEHHLIFFGLFWCTKLFDLGLLFFDPLVQGTSTWSPSP
mmetsp:Transcript_91289/g.262891  ORF Transcript_91289/g.262891 Transcript_91289/m.262891 type:complete len:321 (-) Transcript_91289:185-1147(-)